MTQEVHPSPTSMATILSATTVDVSLTLLAEGAANAKVTEETVAKLAEVTRLAATASAELAKIETNDLDPEGEFHAGMVGFSRCTTESARVCEQSLGEVEQYVGNGEHQDSIDA